MYLIANMHQLHLQFSGGDCNHSRSKNQFMVVQAAARGPHNSLAKHKCVNLPLYFVFIFLFQIADSCFLFSTGPVIGKRYMGIPFFI
ncbi:hypothetical protein IEQ34_009318 [Dendrobium chrysotoxum]|uniref:Uncharacterized protein n=1 Tax=Dendrobium chrysotoxum TaxID=161865 RepID=A0AAV7H194_DENCH|nr:hypothetical protein IEQ34_009318 [Dendrobium chrysotoxum]